MRRFAKFCGLTLFIVLLASPTHAAPVDFFATLSGDAEIPPTGSSATGTAHVTFDNVAHTLVVQASFAGLSTPDIAAHIHCCVPQPGNTGVATVMPAFPAFPLNVTSGNYMSLTPLNTLDLTTYNSAFVSANGGTAASAEAALFNGMVAGQSYFNIHTAQFAGGEIRGILVTPEPGTLLLLSVGLTGLAHHLRRKRRRA
jgi:hypothetical protein